MNLSVVVSVSPLARSTLFMLILLLLLLRISNIPCLKNVLNKYMGLVDTSIVQHGQAITGGNPQYHLCPLLVGKESKFSPVIGIENSDVLLAVLGTSYVTSTATITFCCLLQNTRTLCAEVYTSCSQVGNKVQTFITRKLAF